MEALKKPRKVYFIEYSIFIIILLSLIELGSFILVDSNISSISKYLYIKPITDQKEFDAYLRIRDSYLGWPSDNTLKKYYSKEARISPANFEIKRDRVCASLYGDSFVFSEEVKNEFAWGNILAKKLNCKINNYGVGGYGTGQAILKFKRNSNDNGELIILGIFPDDLARNVNQWRYLLTGGNKFGFKPSYVINQDGVLIVTPIPVNTYQDFIRIIRSPMRVLHNETYLPGSPNFRARVNVSFPYSLVLAKVALKLFNQLDLHKAGEARSIRELNYQSWYDSPNGPDKRKINIFYGLIKLFAEICQQRGKECAVLVIPNYEMVHNIIINEKDEHSFISFLKPMQKYIKVMDSTNYLAKNMLKKGVCFYYGKSRDCIGHFNKEGYGLLANFMYQQMGNTFDFIQK